MPTTAAVRQPSRFLNRIIHGDCIQVMRQMPAQGVDFILTDPPYLASYRDRTGRTLQNDSNDAWLKPAFAAAYRVLKPNRLMLCFYGWHRADKFLAAWRDAGFRPVGHLVFWKSYASKTRFLEYRHEQAYLLAKDNPPLPQMPLPDVLRLPYTGNELHPTQKSVAALVPVIRAFTKSSDTVLDCFCGSGSTCAAALLAGRRFVGIEMVDNYHRAASGPFAPNPTSDRAVTVPIAVFPRRFDSCRVAVAHQDERSTTISWLS